MITNQFIRLKSPSERMLKYLETGIYARAQCIRRHWCILLRYEHILVCAGCWTSLTQNKLTQAAAGQLALPSSSSPTINATSDVSASTDLVVAHPTSIAPSPHSEASHVLAKSYYNLMSTLIDFATSNRELLTAFTDARETSKNKMGAAGAGVVGSLVAGASSMTSFAAGEVVSASLLAPSTLAALGVPGATGSLTFLGPAIVCTNPALLGGAILAGVASLTILAVKNERRKKFNSLSDDCKKSESCRNSKYFKYATDYPVVQFTTSSTLLTEKLGSQMV